GWTGGDAYHDSIEAVLRSGSREWRVKGRVMNLIPLRNRRDEMVTRISEGMTEWTLEDGRVGYGLSEYLDQIVDGKPVGIDEQRGGPGRSGRSRSPSSPTKAAGLAPPSARRTW